MRKHSIFLVAATVVASIGALAQAQTPQQYDKSGAPSGVQSTKRDKLPVVTLPETNAPAASEAPVSETAGQAPKFEDRLSAQGAVPYLPPNATLPNATAPLPQTIGQAPNASKKMGAEMDSAGDQRASPDEH